jgi:hypothetical protein
MNVTKPMFIIILLIMYKFKKFKKKAKPPKFIPDIIIGTGGYYGFYQLGVCHYIMNHFDYSKKNIMGVSAGSWNNVIMALTPEKANIFIRELFVKIPHGAPITSMIDIFQNISKNNVVLDDIDMNKINICVTEFGNSEIKVHTNFLSIDDLCRCCEASSFVPLVTSKDIFYFYKNKMCFDGGIIYKICSNKYTKAFKKALIIKPSMFNRFTWHTGKSFIQPSYSFYELYLLGYHDATVHNTYLSTFFDPVNTNSVNTNSVNTNSVNTN